MTLELVPPLRTWRNENRTWRRRSNLGLCQSYDESDIVDFIKTQRIKGAGHVIRRSEDRTTKKSSMFNQLAQERVGHILDRLMA
ncbi:hypothetical protein TNCV_1206601 [Trichonephila clavipes]|nr:hypothetical protein TNCV_1206601 [Trichonephila clavipes]